MVELEYKHRKAKNMFWWLAFFPFTLFVSVEYYYALKLKTDSSFFIYRKNLGERYDSMKLFDEMFISDFEFDGSADCRAIFAS